MYKNYNNESLEFEAPVFLPIFEPSVSLQCLNSNYLCVNSY